MIDTFFAPAEKASEDEITAEIEIVSRNPFVSGLLHTISGLMAVLDEHRQIISLNDSFLRMLGIDDPAETLGLRPGEVLKCVHSEDKPAGCGTTKYCSTCGAAIAIVSSLGKDEPVEKICALTFDRGGKVEDMALLVRSHPIKIDRKRFILLFLQDITRQQQRAALERTFFHDVNNMLTMLVGSSELLVCEEPSKLAGNIHQAALRLAKEVDIQRCLAQSEAGDYRPEWHKFSTEYLLEEIRAFFVSHPVARRKKLNIAEEFPVISIKTDISLLLRVLCNMIINALEATVENGVVKIWLEQDGDSISFCVWNAQAISPGVTIRIFQRNFSTKAQAGRGLGTFSMKLLGEKILGGQVNFSTSRQDGTIFKLTVPV